MSASSLTGSTTPDWTAIDIHARVARAALQWVRVHRVRVHRVRVHRVRVHRLRPSVMLIRMWVNTIRPRFPIRRIAWSLE